MRGTKKLTMFSRKLSFVKGSRLDLRAPDRPQNFKNLEPGVDGKDGNHGVNGTIGKKMALRAARNLCSYNECHAGFQYQGRYGNLMNLRISQQS